VTDRAPSTGAHSHLPLGGLDDAEPSVAPFVVAPGMVIVLSGIAHRPAQALGQLGGEVFGLKVLRGDTFPEHDGALTICGGRVGHHEDLRHETPPLVACATEHDKDSLPAGKHHVLKPEGFGPRHVV
jgi:hypothetical protein